MKRLSGVFLIATFFVTLMVIQHAPISVATNGTDIQQITHNTFNDTTPIIQADSQKNIHIIWNGWNFSPQAFIPTYMTSKGAGEIATIIDRYIWDQSDIWYPLFNLHYKDLAIDSNGIPHITFCSPSGILWPEIVYANLSSGRFEPIVIITNGSHLPIENQIVIDANDVIHICYTIIHFPLTTAVADVYYMNTSTGGFGTPVTVYSGGQLNTEIVLAVDSNGKAHIAWKITVPPFQSEIYYSNNTLGTFGQPYNVSNDVGMNDSQPAIAVDSQNNAHITWVKSSSPSEIYYSRFNPSDGNFSTPINISQTPTQTEIKPVICIDSSNVVHIAYEGTTATDSEIFYLKKEGSSFNSPTNIADNDDDDRDPSITVDSSRNVHIVWESWVDDIADIYYTKISPPTAPDDGIPGFELLPLLFGVLIVFCWRLQKKKTL